MREQRPTRRAEKRRPARQQKDNQRQKVQQQAEQMQQQFQQQAAQQNLPPLPGKINSVGELQQLLNTYGSALSPQNRAFINELISSVEQGGNQDSLLDLANRMQAAAKKQQP